MKNKSSLIFAVFVLLAVVAVLYGNTAAVENTTMIGYVKTVYDDEYNAKSADFRTLENVSYNITLNDKGKKLAEDCDGEKVEVTGSITKKDGKNWITVESYKTIASEETESDDDDWSEDEESSDEPEDNE